MASMIIKVPSAKMKQPVRVSPQHRVSHPHNCMNYTKTLRPLHYEHGNSKFRCSYCPKFWPHPNECPRAVTEFQHRAEVVQFIHKMLLHSWIQLWHSTCFYLFIFSMYFFPWKGRSTERRRERQRESFVCWLTSQYLHQLKLH